ncbi:UDP-glucose/GDP-mannose dehydrogenase family protein, partial [Streptococcus suis]
NVDDLRESPTLQLLEAIGKQIQDGKPTVYDPFIEKDIVENQLHNLDEFLENVDLVVLLVAHDEIVQNMDKLKNTLVFDTRFICNLDGTYRL